MTKNTKIVRPAPDRKISQSYNPSSGPRMTTEERKLKFEQKQFERMEKARQEKQRKNAMFERGVPKSKPLTQIQLEEQAATRKMLAERKEKMM